MSRAILATLTGHTERRTAERRDKAVTPSEYDEGGEAMRDEFRAFVILLLDMLERGEVDRAIAKLREILSK